MGREVGCGYCDGIEKRLGVCWAIALVVLVPASPPWLEALATTMVGGIVLLKFSGENIIDEWFFGGSLEAGTILCGMLVHLFVLDQAAKHAARVEFMEQCSEMMIAYIVPGFLVD